MLAVVSYSVLLCRGQDSEYIYSNSSTSCMSVSKNYLPSLALNYCGVYYICTLQLEIIVAKINDSVNSVSYRYV